MIVDEILQLGFPGGLGGVRPCILPCRRTKRCWHTEMCHKAWKEGELTEFQLLQITVSLVAFKPSLLRIWLTWYQCGNISGAVRTRFKTVGLTKIVAVAMSSGVTTRRLKYKLMRERATTRKSRLAKPTLFLWPRSPRKKLGIVPDWRCLRIQKLSRQLFNPCHHEELTLP